MTIGQAIVDGNYEEIAKRVQKRFGLEIATDRIAQVISPYLRYPDRLKTIWSEGSWFSWLRNRLDELNAFQPGHQTDNARFEVTMHVFFVYLEETEEMLARLRHESTRILAKAARSKISTTNQVIQPIDRVAARVSQDREE